jgi:TPR repeat protein
MNLRPIAFHFVLLCIIAGCLTLPSVVAQAPNIAALHKQAKEGNAEAQYELAKAYLSGTGVPKDSKQGVDWLRKAANLEHPAAELALAIMYMEGEQYIPKDPKQGLEWLRKSAAQGYGPAEYNLGSLYRRGDEPTGIPKKPHEAANWLRKAARQQGANSQTSLQEMLQQGLISRQEANWQSPEPVTKIPSPAVEAKTTEAKTIEAKTTEAKTDKPKPFSLAEVEKGLQGGITCKRMSVLVDKFKVDFSLNADLRQRLGKEGADDALLATISASKRSL